jgi:hypothetical protein
LFDRLLLSGVGYQLVVRSTRVRSFEIIPAIIATAFQGASLHAEVAELADAHV